MAASCGRLADLAGRRALERTDPSSTMATTCFRGGGYPRPVARKRLASPSADLLGAACYFGETVRRNSWLAP
jgi:hypothetical protein